MFRRTYYVQRAERRSEGEAVMRDTSFSSFMCVLFIFLLICSFIVILSQWRALFLLTDEVEYISHAKNANEFEKIIIDTKNKLKEFEESTITVSETTGITDNAAIWRGSDTTTEGTDMTSSETPATEVTGDETTESTTPSVETTETDETDETVEITATSDNVQLLHTTNNDWYFTPVTRETTSYDSDFDTSDTSASSGGDSETTFTSDSVDTSATSRGDAETSETMSYSYDYDDRHDSTITSDWKRDATLSNSDLIDLDATETENFVSGLTRLFSLPASTPPTPTSETMPTSENTDETSETFDSTATSDITEMSEMMRVNNTIRPEQPEQFYNERSKVRKPGVALYNSLKDKHEVQITAEATQNSLKYNINDELTEITESKMVELDEDIVGHVGN